MTNCYLNCLPRNFMRTMGGHPAQSGCFEIQRAAIEPPQELCKLMWPDLDKWDGRFGDGDGQIHDLAAIGLCKLLHHLRDVILQDSVVLRAQFPNHQIWAHQAFQHKAYKGSWSRCKATYKQKLSQAVLQSSTKQCLQLRSDYLLSRIAPYST